MRAGPADAGGDGQYDPHPLTALPHRIERTRNRSSRAVLDGDTVVIRLAHSLSAHEEREHVAILLRRMQSHRLREGKRTPIEPFRPLLEGEQTLVLPLSTGDTCAFVLEPGKRMSARRTGEGWRVSIGQRTDRRTLHRFLWRLLCEHQQRAITDLLREINASTLHVRVTDVRLRYATSQWGSCSDSGKISLNPALLFLPRTLLEYVIVHELAHRFHRGHTKDYWRDVERAFPTYRQARTALRNYRLKPF